MGSRVQVHRPRASGPRPAVTPVTWRFPAELAPAAARRQTGAMPNWDNEGAMTSTCTQEWAAANPASAAHAQRASRVLPGGVTHDARRAAPFPLAVARADGAHKWDLDGHEIICYVMGHGALLLGHSHPGVVAAVRHQATVAFLPGGSHELEA
jgi:Aminotransferase class-III